MSGLRSDEAIEGGDILSLCDRDGIGLGVAIADPQDVASSSEDLQDVG
jgi:hypothetical protein